MITSTRHCIERYNERCQPTLDRKKAMLRLDEELIEARLTHEEPWRGCDYEGTSLWAVIEGGTAACPIETDRFQRKFAVTCITKEMTDESRFPSADDT